MMSCCSKWKTHRFRSLQVSPEESRLHLFLKELKRVPVSGPGCTLASSLTDTSAPLWAGPGKVGGIGASQAVGACGGILSLRLSADSKPRSLLL